MEKQTEVEVREEFTRELKDGTKVKRYRRFDKFMMGSDIAKQKTEKEEATRRIHQAHQQYVTNSTKYQDRRDRKNAKKQNKVTDTQFFGGEMTNCEVLPA